MQHLTLAFAAGAFVTSTLALAVTVKVAIELKKAKTHVDTELAGVKQKAAHNLSVLKAAFRGLEF